MEVNSKRLSDYTSLFQKIEMWSSSENPGLRTMMILMPKCCQIALDSGRHKIWSMIKFHCMKFAFHLSYDTPGISNHETYTLYLNDYVTYKFWILNMIDICKQCNPIYANFRCVYVFWGWQLKFIILHGTVVHVINIRIHRYIDVFHNGRI